jgi:hypothetical protein
LSGVQQLQGLALFLFQDPQLSLLGLETLFDTSQFFLKYFFLVAAVI